MKLLNVYTIISMLLFAFFGCLNVYDNPKSKLSKMEYKFNQPGTTNISTVDSYISLVAYIQNAKSYIRCAFNSFTDTYIADELIKQKNNGITVEIVGDKDNAGDMGFVKCLQEEIKVVFNSQGEMEHNFIIVDDKYVWLNSSAPRPEEFAYSHNVCLNIKSELFAEEFDREFNQLINGVFGDFGREKFGGFEYGKATPDNDNTFYFDDVKLNTYFGPQEAPIKELLKIIFSAKKSVYFFVSNLKYIDLYNTICYKKRCAFKNPPNPDFTVKGVIDEQAKTDPASRYNDIKNYGLDCKVFENSNKKISSNVFIIDKDTPEAKICILSSDFALVPYNNGSDLFGFDITDGTLIVLSKFSANANDTIYKDFYQKFEDIYNSSNNM